MKNILKIAYIIFFLYGIEIIYAGTDGTVRGRVTDEDSMGLPGATVYIPEIGAGTAADAEGNFIILNNIGSAIVKDNIPEDRIRWVDPLGLTDFPDPMQNQDTFVK